ncbi:autotransporter outer membrane beta-barrel domain-containing protein [Leptotrichia alba]|uniref:Autotransporter outer membrane beta-barrel domain-containing protein n=1 Tax=Leptotrichia alba TaxID=3239304 RepID=A0AB39V3V5_9FUSO
MKKMRNAKRLVLLTALCAIISCGGGGGGGTASNNPTPTNPNNPSNPGNPTDLTMRSGDSRYTKTKLEDMTDKDYLKDFVFKEAADKNEIKYEEYGYKLAMGYRNFFPSSLTTMDSNGITYSSSPTTSSSKIVVENGGIGLSVNDRMEYVDSSPSFHAVPYQELKDKLDFAINKIITQFANKLPNLREIEIKEGGTLITFEGYDGKGRTIYLNNGLEEYQFGHYNGTPYGVSLNLTGNGDIFKFKNYIVSIGENINLDDPSNKYTKTLKKMINPGTDVKEGVKITGSKNNQIGIREIGGDLGGTNYGTIELKGNNTIGVYMRNSTISNYGTINVDKNSTGIYAIYDKDYDNDRGYNNPLFSNYRDINIGENSTGIYVYAKYYDLGVAAHSGNVQNDNIYNGIRADENAANAVGMLLDAGEEKSKLSNSDSNAFIWNNGIIELKGDRSTGMYLTGKGKATAENTGGSRPSGMTTGGEGRIIIGDSKDVNRPGIGMYSDNPNGRIGNATDYAIIEIGKNGIGMAGVNKTKVENAWGTIIIKGDNSIGMYLSDGAVGSNFGTIKTEGSPKNAIGVFVGKDAEFSNDHDGEIIIDSEGGAGIVIAGGTVSNYGIIKVSGGAVRVKNVSPVLAVSLSDKIMPVKKDMRVYVDSLGKTNPIEGLANLGLKGAELLIGAEATEKTNATEVTVGKDVLDPFNKSIKESNIPYWTVGSGSLIWEANPEIKDNRVEKVTLKKQSYTKFADEKTKDVAKGLDEKYVVASEKDKQIFNYMNTLKDAESLGKVYKEIDGSQYINVQQRINQTDNLLDNQISSLQKDNVGKAGHHVETFFNKDKHDFKTEEVPNTTSTAFGASYLFNNTDSNWGAYGGVAINNYKFKDKGHSKESVSMLKAGGYKKLDLNIGDLDWTLGGDVFISQNSMKRRIMTDKVYENKADYNAYGFSVKNEISKTYELGENGTIKPYGALKLGYGSFGKIKEKDATIGLDVKGNSYYSVKPAAGIELGYAKQLTDKTKLKASLDLAYEHELGKVDHKENEIKFINARTGYKRKSAKDESRGNLSTGVKVRLETGRFNFSVKGGYDTKDKNAHVGVGIGASF